MKLLSQRCALWADDKLGASSLSVGRYGCTSTAISMLSDYFGHYVSPADIAKHKEFYTKDGLILWIKLKFEGFGFEKRLYGRNDAEIQISLKDPKKACILEVQGKHWVVCTGKDILGRYKIADPWFGDLSTMSRYKDEITGSAHFEQK